MTAVMEPETIARTPGKYERRCWERHEADLRAAYGDPWNDPTVYGDASRSQHPKGFWFDEDAGQRVVQFIEGYCRHFEGEWAGQPIVLEAWQRSILRIVFGWRRVDGTRRFRTVYIEIPRKNGKSTWAGGVGLYLTIADNEPGAQVYATATKRDQAKIVWGAAAAMIRQSPRLRKFARALKNNIHCARLSSKFEPLAADSNTQDGFNTHAQIADEMHAHRDRHVYDVVATSMGARRQPLNWIITTAGIYSPESIGWEMHERAMQILDGVIEDDTFFAFIAAADDGDDWEDPATWAKANPNIGVSVKLAYLEEQAERARTTPSFQNTFLRYHLNRWTQQRDRWIPIERWDACPRVVDPELLEGRVCCAGLDLSSKLDITALALAFPWVDEDESGIDLLWHFWCPEEAIQERSKKDRVPYDAWARDGWLTPTPGNVVDYAFPVRALEAAAQRYELREIAFDPWNATATATQLQELGLTPVEFRQGYGSMSEPSKEFERQILAQTLGHLTPNGVNPVMRWMVSNVAIRRDPAENIKPDKSSATGRIDGVVAAIMALGRAAVQTTNDEWRPL